MLIHGFLPTLCANKCLSPVGVRLFELESRQLVLRPSILYVGGHGQLLKMHASLHLKHYRLLMRQCTYSFLQRLSFRLHSRKS